MPLHDIHSSSHNSININININIVSLSSSYKCTVILSEPSPTTQRQDALEAPRIIMSIKTTVGILSIGEMGLGVAKLLIAHNFGVLTSLEGRSEATKKRAASANIRTLETDTELVREADVVLSIVPPRDATATAQRILTAMKSAQRTQQHPLYFVDLNAISPKQEREIAQGLQSSEAIRFIGGGIIGGAPKEKENGEWQRPDLPVSGPHQLKDAQPEGARLAEVLNMRHIGDKIGTATGLKMCFASMTKGLTAIAIQAFTTAHTLGVHDELLYQLEHHSPKTGQLAAGGLTGMPPKAYRWVAEMQQIAATMREEGGFEGISMFDEVAKVYEIIADDTLLGEEKTENRQRGKTTEDVATLTREGLLGRTKKQ